MSISVQRYCKSDSLESWEIKAIGNEFLNWMRQLFPEDEDVNWRLNYYSGSMTIVTCTNEQLMSAILLKWS